MQQERATVRRPGPTLKISAHLPTRPLSQSQIKREESLKRQVWERYHSWSRITSGTDRRIKPFFALSPRPHTSAGGHPYETTCHVALRLALGCQASISREGWAPSDSGYLAQLPAVCQALRTGSASRFAVHRLY
jgi:hypothetical protein